MADEEPHSPTDPYQVLVAEIQLTDAWKRGDGDDLHEALQLAGFGADAHALRMTGFQSTLTLSLTSYDEPAELEKKVKDVLGAFQLGHPGMEYPPKSIRVHANS